MKPFDLDYDPELFTSIVQSQMTKQDIIAFGYRKKQLE